MLRKIANTLTTNVDSLCPIGLFEGKMGVCLFYFRYSKCFKSSFYSDLSFSVVEDIIKSIKRNDIKFSTIQRMSEIGIGMSLLLGGGFVDRKDCEKVLFQIDNIVLNAPTLPITNDYNYNIFTSGLYLVKRCIYSPNTLDTSFIEKYCKKITSYVEDNVKSLLKEPSKELMCSIVYSLEDLYKILKISVISETSIYLRDIGQVVEENIKKDSESFYKQQLKVNGNRLFEKNKYISDDSYYYWKCYLYDIEPVFGNEMLEEYDDLISNSYYKRMISINKLCSIGHCLLNIK